MDNSTETTGQESAELTSAEAAGASSTTSADGSQTVSAIGGGAGLEAHVAALVGEPVATTKPGPDADPRGLGFDPDIPDTQSRKFTYPDGSTVFGCPPFAAQSPKEIEAAKHREENEALAKRQQAVADQEAAALAARQQRIAGMVTANGPALS